MGIPKERLKNLSSLSSKDAFINVINAWKELKKKPYIWDTFLKALESSKVNEKESANELMSKFFTKQYI